MPTAAATATKADPIIDTYDGHTNPKYTSYVTRNASLIVARTTNSQLRTDKDGKSKDLVKGDNKDLIPILGPDYSDQFKSPYDTVDLIRFHEAWRDDGIAASALDFLVQFMLGDHFKTIIDVNSEFDTEEEANAALEFYTNNPQIRSYKRKLDQINRELKFQTHLFSLLVQSFVFGRACALVEKSDIDSLPIALKILPSMHLGQVYVHRKSWDVIGVEHMDFPFPASIIKSEDMMYIAVRDHNVSPGTLHYGYSLFERIADLSELNRITNQRNLKEINYRLWAALLLIKLPGSYNQAVMKRLKEELKNGAGNSIVTNQAAEFEVLKVDHDMEKLLDQRDANYREIIRQLQVPIILFDPDILNRATSQELMEAWTVSVLENYRSWLGDVIQDQWNNPIIKQMIENERDAARQPDAPENRPPLTIPKEGKPGEPEPLSKKLEQSSTPETDEEGKTIVTPSVTKEVIPIEAIDPKTGEILMYRLPWKIKVEFEPKNYDTYKEKAETAILLKNNGLATTATALKMIGVKDENEIAQLLELEEQRQAERFAMVGAQQIDAAGKAVGSSDDKKVDPTVVDKVTGAGAGAPKGKQPSTVEKQRLKFREGLRTSVTGKNVPTKEGVRPKRVGLRRTPL